MPENLTTPPFTSSQIQPDSSDEPPLANPLELAAQVPFIATPRSAPPVQQQPLYFLCVNYHSAALISDLLQTLEANQGIVIVNNSPADKAIHRLSGSTFSGGSVTVIDAPDNGGFGAGCNLGLQWIYKRSPQALIWIINPDATLIPGAIAQIRQCFANAPDIAILGTPVLSSQGDLWFASGRFNRWTGSIQSRIALRPPKSHRPSDPLPTRWVTGCSTIFNLALLEHCPQFDETYFLYYEDCDLCERYFQQGYAIAILPIPLVVHAVSSITSRYLQAKFVHGTYSKLIFLQRHATLLALALNLLYLSARALSETFTRPLAAKGRWQGIWQFLQNPNPKAYASALSSNPPPHHR